MDMDMAIGKIADLPKNEVVSLKCRCHINPSIA